MKYPAADVNTPVSSWRYLLLGILLMLFSVTAQAANCTASYTYTDSGTASNYDLNSGQSLKIASGTYTGTVNTFANGSNICVETGATFAPGNLNNAAGTLSNHGTANLQTFSYNTGTVIDNYGTLSFLGGLNTNGATTFHNRTDATMNMATSFQLGNNSTFINDGTVVAQQDFNTQNGTTLTNNHRLELEGNFNPDGKFDNYGRVYAKKFMNINANSDVSNYCTLVSYDGFNNNSPLMDNEGTILIATAAGTPGGPWQNNQAFHNGSNAKIAGGNFINNSTFTGGGWMIFSGDTRNQGPFNGNSAADKITFYDETQTGAQIFDVIGTAPTNTVRAAFIRPTELDAPTNCSISYKSFALKAGGEDFGDAPASYGDASHSIVAGIHLGTQEPDTEIASQYTFNASGDGADEDGAPRYPAGTGPAEAALFPVLKMTDSSYTTPVTVTNTTGIAGKLYGWIDFDKSGTFEADEAASTSVPTGSSTASVNLTWNTVPVDIKLGTTFIRFRLTTDAGVTTSTPAGNASNGEVEDYPIAVYQQIAPDSPSLSVISGADPSSCQSTIFTDDFNDLGGDVWGINRTGTQNIRNWTASGGGTNTYAYSLVTSPEQQMSVYFGNGSVRGIYPPMSGGFTFDANGHLTSAIEAIALRDTPDNLDTAHWGPEPVKLSRSFPTQAGKKYRMYFKAIPEDGTFTPGIMRVDAPGGSIHFKAPGSAEPIQSYAIEFTANTATSTIAFVNYGHIANNWCEPQINTWCTQYGTPDAANELLVDDVVLAAVENCDNGNITGTIYTDSNGNNAYDTVSESGIVSITVTLKNNATNAIIATTATAANGAYSFTNLDPALTYRIEADAADTDLAGKTIGTTNPLVGVTVTAGGTTANQNFGFDLPPATPLECTVLDNFDTAATNIIELSSTNLGPVTQTWMASVDSVIGGARTVTVGPGNANTDTKVSNWYGLLEMSNKASSSAPLKVCYNANGTGLNVNLTATDNILFKIWDELHYNPDPATRTVVPLTVTLSDGTTSASLSQDIGKLVYDQIGSTTDDYANIRFPLANFSNIARLDLQHVQSFCFEVADTQNGYDYSFEKVVLEDSNTCSEISGKVFEDVNYGGGNGRPFGTAGTQGINAARLELYDAAGNFIETADSQQHPTQGDGHYAFSALPQDTYHVRVVNSSVSSTRTGSDTSELGVMTYRANGTAATTNEVGGRKPNKADADYIDRESTLNTTTMVFQGGSLDTQQAQSVQPVIASQNNIGGVNFGFNFDTIVNANDSGQGSLRQFLLNANLLGSDAALAQNGRTAGKENAILALPTSDPNYNGAGKYWSIPLQSALPDIIAPMILDSSMQAGFTSTPLLELKGNNAGASSNGLTLATGSDGSTIRYLSITGFAGDGIVVTGSSKGNSILSNSIYSNGGLGIDLGNDGVTANDAGDTDSGPNNLLNYPAVLATSFATNGSKIITYDFNLDLPSGDYRIEFFKSAAKDPSGNGEGQTFLGSKDFSHPGGGSLNFKGSFNANQAVSTAEFVAVTVTEKTGIASFGSTSEFSGSVSNNTALVCTDLISNPGAALPDMMIDENATTVTYLKAKDSSGNPVTYAISGGVDGGMFTVAPPVNGTIDCTQIQFVKTLIVKDAPSETRAIIPGGMDPGNFEVPMDQGRDNIYDLEITATDSKGAKYVRSLSLRVMDVNEAPIITSSAAVSVEEDGSTLALDINSQDQDAVDVEGSTLTYSLAGGADKDKFTLDISTGVLNFKAVPDYDAPADSNQDNVYEVVVTVTDHGGMTASKTFSITILNRTADDGVKLKVRAILQGAYDNQTGLMTANLNTLGLLPGLQPYNVAPFNHKGTETLGSMAKEGTGNDAIVDWLLLELRTSPATVISSKAVVVQRDGDLVDAQSGSPTLHFASIASGNYYVSVRHRNHLGVMSASPVSLGSTEKLVDFSLNTTAVKGTDTRFTSGKLALLWVGDINGSNTLTSSGPGNDTTSLLSSVLGSKDNPNAYTNYALPGYLATDLNMDGKTLFSGPNNDANILIGNVLLHPLNSSFAANYIVRGGL